MAIFQIKGLKGIENQEIVVFKFKYQPIRENILKMNYLPTIRTTLVQVQIVLILIFGVLGGCRDEIPIEPLNGEISGSININGTGLPIETLVRDFDNSGEALLIFLGDTISRQLIESNSYFDNGEFFFKNLDQGNYELMVRKEGFIDRHFVNISINQENKIARDFITLYKIPQMRIDSISAKLIDNYKLDLWGRFSNWSEISNYFVILFSSSNKFDPSTVDFSHHLIAYKEEFRDTVFLNNFHFEEYGYNPGDSVFMNFIPQSRTINIYQVPSEKVPFGPGTKEIGIPIINQNEAITIGALVP